MTVQRFRPAYAAMMERALAKAGLSELPRVAVFPVEPKPEPPKRIEPIQLAVTIGNDLVALDVIGERVRIKGVVESTNEELFRLNILPPLA